MSIGLIITILFSIFLNWSSVSPDLNLSAKVFIQSNLHYNPICLQVQFKHKNKHFL